MELANAFPEQKYYEYEGMRATKKKVYFNQDYTTKLSGRGNARGKGGLAVVGMGLKNINNFTLRVPSFHGYTTAYG